jgi:hypothetical protein
MASVKLTLFVQFSMSCGAAMRDCGPSEVSGLRDAAKFGVESPQSPIWLSHPHATIQVHMADS